MSERSNLKAILFDMDGTLCDTMPVVYQALQETFLVYARQYYSEAEITLMFGPSEEGVIRPRVAAEDYPAALSMYLDRYAELHEQIVQPVPGVDRLLAMLRERGVRRAVVTGKGRGTAEISMRALRLEPHIEMLVTGSEEGAEKPAAIRQVLDAWGLAPSQAAYVGDMPYDMQAAREAGVLALGAAWGSGATLAGNDGADVVFRSVDEMYAWVMEE